MRNRIIALIDTSNTDNNISNYTIQLAKTIKADVIFCDIITVDNIAAYSMQQPSVGSTAVAPIYTRKVATMMEDVEQALQTTCEKHADEWEFTDYEVLKGTNYIDELKKLISDKNANLLITGRDESPNFLEKWLGNRMTMIADATRIPTLVVPRNHTFKPFKNILHHIELKGRDMAKLKRTVQFARQFDAKVTAAFFDSHEQYMLFSRRITLLSKVARYPKLSFEYYKIENIKESLNTLSQEKKIDLIAMNYQDNNVLHRLVSNDYTDHIILSLDVPFFIY